MILKKKIKLITGKSITVTGEKTAYSFVPRVPGEYEIRVYPSRGQQLCQQVFL